MHVVIVGASVAGIRTAQALRAREFDGPITVIGDEPRQPYDKPPLSKQMLDPATDGEPIALLPVEAIDELHLDVHLGNAGDRARHDRQDTRPR